MKNITSILLLSFFLILSGCAGNNKKGLRFESTMRSYEQVIRWGDLEKANGFLKEPADFSLERHKKLKNIQVNGYYVLSRTVTRDGIEQVVEIKYTKDASVVVHTLTDVQKWVYDEDDGRWYLTSKIPDFK